MKLDAILRTILTGNKDERERVYGPNGRDVRFYKDDINLRVEIWNQEEAGTHNMDFKEPWANKHPDPLASSQYVFLFYGSTIIKRYTIVSVDGGRALIPLPSVPDKKISREDYAMASLFDDMSTLDRYIRQSGLTVE